MNYHNFRQILEQYLPDSLTGEQQAALFVHFKFVERWSARMNLTAVEAPDEAVVRHYCESIFFAINMPEEQTDVSIADIGSGAGFPGVPLAVLRPQWKVTLVESNQRKAVFLRESTRHLGNLAVAAKRAESLETSYEWIVSRAVKHTEMLALVPAVAPRIGLLSTEELFRRFPKSPRFTWNNPIAIPWDTRRLCLYARST